MVEGWKGLIWCKWGEAVVGCGSTLHVQGAATTRQTRPRCTITAAQIKPSWDGPVQMWTVSLAPPQSRICNFCFHPSILYMTFTQGSFLSNRHAAALHFDPAAKRDLPRPHHSPHLRPPETLERPTSYSSSHCVPDQSPLAGIVPLNPPLNTQRKRRPSAPRNFTVSEPLLIFLPLGKTPAHNKCAASAFA